VESLTEQRAEIILDYRLSRLEDAKIVGQHYAGSFCFGVGREEEGQSGDEERCVNYRLFVCLPLPRLSPPSLHLSLPPASLPLPSRPRVDGSLVWVRHNIRWLGTTSVVPSRSFIEKVCDDICDDNLILGSDGVISDSAIPFKELLLLSVGVTLNIFCVQEPIPHNRIN
jgi:hypothetical protein